MPEGQLLLNSRTKKATRPAGSWILSICSQVAPLCWLRYLFTRPRFCSGGVTGSVSIKLFICPLVDFCILRESPSPCQVDFSLSSRSRRFPVGFRALKVFASKELFRRFKVAIPVDVGRDCHVARYLVNESRL